MPEPSHKRVHSRFEVPGAFISYKEAICNLVSLGKGGLAFSTENHFRPGRKLSVLLTYSVKQAPIQLHGRVVYCISKPGRSNRYTVGISFAPFSAGRGNNSPESYEVIQRLEDTNIERRPHSIHRCNPSLPAASR